MVVGVVIVTYNAKDVIATCLASLGASEDVDLRILVVDNASRDGTAEQVRAWAAGTVAVEADDRIFRAAPPKVRPLLESDGEPLRIPEGAIGLIRSAENLGFAGGVNVGLRAFLAMPEVDSFWILNPDCVVENGTARTLVDKARAAGRYGVIGGRIFYQSPPWMIQADGGHVDFWTGTCHSFNLGRIGREVVVPPDSALDYVVGAHMFVSREFVATAGLMPEGYFLFYEEVEWCLRRGTLPLLFCPEAAVHHLGGHSIGSATLARGPSPLSAYFMARNRLRFLAAIRPVAVPVGFGYGLLKALRCLARRQVPAGHAMLRGLFGLPPSRHMLQRINRPSLPVIARHDRD